MNSQISQAASLTVTVRLFARFREEIAAEPFSQKLEPGSTIAELLRNLAARGGPWQQLAGEQPVMVAVNQTMARLSQTLSEGDDVALFPPVTGG